MADDSKSVADRAFDLGANIAVTGATILGGLGQAASLAAPTLGSVDIPGETAIVQLAEAYESSMEAAGISEAEDQLVTVQEAEREIDNDRAAELGAVEDPPAEMRDVADVFDDGELDGLADQVELDSVSDDIDAMAGEINGVVDLGDAFEADMSMDSGPDTGMDGGMNGGGF